MDLSIYRIRVAYGDTAKGKRNESNQQRIRYRFEEWSFELQAELRDGTFRPSPFRIKQIYFPKPRTAQVPNVRDKTVQNLLFQGSTYDDLTRSLIKESTANTRGRGTDYARALLKRQLQSFWAKYHVQPWVLKADVHGFFASIPAEGAAALAERYVTDPQAREIMRLFIANSPKGLPLGLRQSQALANLYLSELDHLTKERWHFRYYQRHMDDFLILSPDRERLEAYLVWLEDYLAGIGLELNPKTGIAFNRFDYLGFEYRMTETGKVVARMAKGKRAKKNRHLRRMVAELERGEITPEKFAERYFGWRLHALKGNTRNMVRNTDRRMNARLNQIGYQLRIVRHRGGKVHWRVVVEPLGGISCHQDISHS